MKVTGRKAGAHLTGVSEKDVSLVCCPMPLLFPLSPQPGHWGHEEPQGCQVPTVTAVDTSSSALPEVCRWIWKRRRGGEMQQRVTFWEVWSLSEAAGMSSWLCFTCATPSSFPHRSWAGPGQLLSARHSTVLSQFTHWLLGEPAVGFQGGAAGRLLLLVTHGDRRDGVRARGNIQLLSKAGGFLFANSQASIPVPWKTMIDSEDAALKRAGKSYDHFNQFSPE